MISQRVIDRLLILPRSGYMISQRVIGRLLILPRSGYMIIDISTCY